MGDKDRIKHMEDANWKPSNQYWKDKAEKLQKDLTRTALDYLAAEGQAQENLQRALEAEKKLSVYQSVIRSLYPDMSGYYFICGSGGAEDKNGLPERLSVCPAMGVGWSVTYVKTDQISSLEGL
jgi:hypothetical protein